MLFWSEQAPAAPGLYKKLFRPAAATADRFLLPCYYHLESRQNGLHNTLGCGTGMLENSKTLQKIQETLKHKLTPVLNLDKRPHHGLKKWRGFFVSTTGNRGWHQHRMHKRSALEPMANVNQIGSEWKMLLLGDDFSFGGTTLHKNW